LRTSSATPIRISSMSSPSGLSYIRRCKERCETSQRSRAVSMPLSLGPVRQTFPAIQLYQNLSLCHLNLGGRSGPGNAGDGALCEGLFTVMEWPCRRGISSPFWAIYYPKHQTQAGRQLDHRIHSRQSMPFQNRPITGIWAQHQRHILVPERRRTACTSEATRQAPGTRQEFAYQPVFRVLQICRTSSARGRDARQDILVGSYIVAEKCEVK
jgi:hypothetical protein